MVQSGKPKTTSYVTKTRERLGLGTEVYFWFSPSQHPKASNLKVLEPYSERHLRTIAAGGQRFNGLSGSRQGHPGLRYRTDNGGRIPFDFIQCGSEGPSGPYGRYCKAHGLPLHPARMPARPANFWIRFTTDPGDVVADPSAAHCRSQPRLKRWEGTFSRATTRWNTSAEAPRASMTRPATRNTLTASG